MSPVFPEEPGDPALGLEQRHDRIQVHTVDPLYLESDVIAEDLGNAGAVCYLHLGLRSSMVPRDHQTASAVQSGESPIVGSIGAPLTPLVGLRQQPR